MTTSVIKNGRLVLPDGIVEGDLLIVDGRIERVGGVLSATGAAEEIDASGLHVLPGLVDSHVHLREPGLTHKECLRTGTAAAVRGGVTSLLEMPNTRPATLDQAALDAKLDIAAREAYAHHGFYIGASLHNLDALRGAERTPGIKIFVGSSTGDLLVDDQATLERIFAETTLPIAVHAEEESLVQANAAREASEPDPEPAVHSRIRTPEAAARSIARIVELARRHRHPTHVLHVSTRAELAVLPLDEPLVTAEVCIPHLFLDTRDYDRLGHFAKVNPALREPADREATWEALRAGRFANVATDHAPHLPDEKRQRYHEAPSGAPSLENSLSLMLDAHLRGLLGLLELVRLMCQQPAELWHIRGKGKIAEGYDADLVLVDLTRERTIRNEDQWSRAGWSPWHGTTLRGWPVRTLVMGQTIVRDDQLVGQPSGTALVFESASATSL